MFLNLHTKIIVGIYIVENYESRRSLCKVFSMSSGQITRDDIAKAVILGTVKYNYGNLMSHAPQWWEIDSWHINVIRADQDRERNLSRDISSFLLIGITR